jgi:hypothetical protein
MICFISFQDQNELELSIFGYVEYLSLKILFGARMDHFSVLLTDTFLFLFHLRDPIKATKRPQGKFSIELYSI